MFSTDCTFISHFRISYDPVHAHCKYLTVYISYMCVDVCLCMLHTYMSSYVYLLDIRFLLLIQLALLAVVLLLLLISHLNVYFAVQPDAQVYSFVSLFMQYFHFFIL